MATRKEANSELSQGSRTDLVQISKLTNLGVLTIGQNVTTIDDSIVRGWGRTASSSDAFGLLRVLNCQSQKDITAGVFAHLNQFPALSVFNVKDCKFGPKHRHSARNYGWNNRPGKDLSDWLVEGGTTGAGWDSIVHADFQLGGAFSEERLTAEGVEAIDAMPVLHVSVGAAQSDEPVDVIGDGSLFYRERIDTIRFPNKRRLSQDIAPSIKMTRRKTTSRVVRASKQQNMEDLLTGFGGWSCKLFEEREERQDPRAEAKGILGPEDLEWNIVLYVLLQVFRGLCKLSLGTRESSCQWRLNYLRCRRWNELALWLLGFWGVTPANSLCRVRHYWVSC